MILNALCLLGLCAVVERTYAEEARTPTMVYRTVLPGLPVADPAFVVNGAVQIVVAPANRTVISFDHDGRVSWRVALGWLPVIGPLATPDGGWYLVSADGAVARIDAYGRLAASFRLDGVAPRGAVVDRYGVLTLAGREIVQVSPIGTVLWRRAVRSTVPPVRVGDRTWFIDADGRIIAIDTAGAATVVERSTGAVNRLAGGPARGWVVWEQGATSVLGCYDAGGRLRWRTVLPHAVQTLIPLRSGAVIVVRATGTITRVDSEGSSSWTFDLPGRRIVSVAASEVAVVVADETGEVTILDQRGGHVGRLSHEKPLVRVSLEERTVVAIADDWSMYLYTLPPELFLLRHGATPSSALPPALPARAEPTPLSVYAANILSGSALSPRERLMELIETRFRSRRLDGELETVRSVLHALATEVYTQPVREGSAVRNDFPSVRERAVHRLAALSDSAALASLRLVVIRDPHPQPAAAAAQALARYGRLTDPAVPDAVLQRLARASAGERDIAAAMAVVVAQAAAQDQPQAAVELLRAVVAAPVAIEVRREAVAALRQLEAER